MSETLEHGGLLEQDELPPVAEEVETEPAPVAETAPEPQQPAEAPKQVPLAELLKERAARKEAAAELARQREAYARGEQELRELRQMVEQMRAPPPAAPDLATDPVAHFEHKTRTLETELAAIRAERQKQAEMVQRQTAEQELVSRYVTANKEYAASTPDWNDAYTHVTQGLFHEAKIMGANDAQAWQYVHEAEKRIAQAAFANGENPGRNLYEIAKARGYQAKAPKAPAAEQIATMARGQAARTVGGGGARAANDYSGLTLDALVGLPDEEFAKVPEGVKRRLMGG